MAGEIKITPELLKNQAILLSSLQEEYEALFSSVTSDLNRMNGNWSSLLANNFSGKINSAQKSFSNVTSMLEAGAKAATESAQSFTDVDKAMAKIMSENGVTEGAQQIADINVSTDKVAKDYRKLGEVSGMECASSYSSDPVNLCNGNYVYEESWLEIDAVIPISFHIFYNSNDVQGCSLGKGWMQNNESYLLITQNNIKVKRPDGSFFMFILIENDTYVAANGTLATLSKNENGYLVVDEKKVTWAYDLNGKLISQKDTGKVEVFFSYNKENQLEKVEDVFGNTLNYLHNENGQIIKVEDHAGRSISLEYEDGNLYKVNSSEGRSVSYKYDERGYLCEIINAKNISVLKNTFDDRGRVIHQEFSDGGQMMYFYDDERGRVTLTEQNGNQIHYDHDELFRNIRNIYDDGEESFSYNSQNQKTSVTDKRGNTTKYEYDQKGNLSAFHNALGESIYFSYTEDDQIESIKVGEHVLQRAVYDGKKRQIETINANNGHCYFEYDDRDQITEIILEDGLHSEMEYDRYGHTISITNSMGGKTRYIYDSLHRVVCTIDPLGNKTKYEYNSFDEIVKVLKSDGSSICYEYDLCGNLIHVIDEIGGESYIDYNSMNKPVKYVDAEGNITTWEYDTMWNVIKRVDPNGGENKFVYDKHQQIIEVENAVGAREHVKYDPCGNMVERIDAEGGVYGIEYDALNRPIKTIDPCGNIAVASYDSLGNVTSVIHPDGSVEELKYDLLGNCIYKKERNGYELFFSYNEVNLLLEVRDEQGWLEKYSYYPGGLLKEEKYNSGESNIYEYDINENLITITNQDGVIYSFQYDCMNRVNVFLRENEILEKYEYDASGNVISVSDGEGNQKSYLYSPNGNLISTTDENGFTTHYEYNSVGNLIGIIQDEVNDFSVEKINSFNQQQKKRKTIFQWDMVGNMTKVIDSLGNEECYSYDACGRLIAKTDAEGNQTIIEYYRDGSDKKYILSDGRSVTMQYDELRQLVQMEDWTGITEIRRNKNGMPESVTVPNGDTIQYQWGNRGERAGIVYPNGRKVSYKYDNVSRLIGLNNGEEQITYSYYSNGKLKEKHYPGDYVTAYQYDKEGRISQLTHKKTEEILEELTYFYDKNGRKSAIQRQSSLPGNSGLYQYQYNPVGSIEKVLHDKKIVEEYQYDAYGNRIRKRTKAGTTYYQYNSLNQLVYMKDTEGEHRYEYDRVGNLRKEVLDGETVKKYTFGAMNLISSVQSKNATAYYSYNGFGQRITNQINYQNGGVKKTTYLYDITKSYKNLLGQTIDDISEYVIWDEGLLATFKTSCKESSFIMTDERMTPLLTIYGKERQFCQRQDTFGGMHSDSMNMCQNWGFSGFIHDEVSGLQYANLREYSPDLGRFISRDAVRGSIVVPLALNEYLYCRNDSINYVDPSGAIAVWLAGGIVGSIANVAGRAAGDVVNSVKNKKITVSSWQSYLGSAAGGFVQGTVLVATGGVAGNTVAGAAGGAVESLVTNGLNMASGVKGYTKADGYTWKDMLTSAGKSAVEGAIGGFAFGNLEVKIPGITKGRGSWMSTWKQVVTKAQKGIIKHVSLKTLAKAVVVYGGVGFISGIYKKAKKVIEEEVVEAVIDYISSLFKTEKSKSTVSAKEVMSGNVPTARCGAT